MAEVIVLEPTGKIGSEGYYETKVSIGTLVERNFKEVYSWISDNVQFRGELHMDFEANGKITIWRHDHDIWVQESYGTVIWGGKEAKQNDLNRIGWTLDRVEFERLANVICANIQ